MTLPPHSASYWPGEAGESRMVRARTVLVGAEPHQRRVWTTGPQSKDATRKGLGTQRRVDDLPVRLDCLD